MSNANTLVLVSGASGYLGCHCVQQLLKEGYKVRGTVRSLKNEEKVRPIREVCPEAAAHLELVEAELLKQETWPPAVKGCDYVLHTASPFPGSSPANEDELIKPAVEGSLNVLKACAQEKSVKRVVLTSSVAAIASGWSNAEKATKTFDEKDWSKVDVDYCSAYEKSKTMAEQAAWDFVKNIKEGENKFELTTICPSFIVGPMLHKTECTSAQVVKRFMNRDMPMIPNLSLGYVDVRDVGLAHIRSMRAPGAAGQRFLVTERTMTLKDMSLMLQKEFGPMGYKPPSLEAPYSLLWVASFFDKQIRMILPNVGVPLLLDNKKVREALGMNPLRPINRALVDMGHSLIEKGIVKRTSAYKPPVEVSGQGEAKPL